MLYRYQSIFIRHPDNKQYAAEYVNLEKGKFGKMCIFLAQYVSNA